MTIQEITNKAADLGFTAEQMDLLLAGIQAGMTAGVMDAAETLADNDEGDAAEFLATNYGFEIA